MERKINNNIRCLKITESEKIKKTYKDLRLWYLNANIHLKSLSNEDKKYLKSKIQELKQKNSKRLVYIVADKIGDILNMDIPVKNPLDLCWNYKFDGFFGINFVIKKTIDNINIR